jgi:hypothetical protein
MQGAPQRTDEEGPVINDLLPWRLQTNSLASSSGVFAKLEPSTPCYRSRFDGVNDVRWLTIQR